MLYAAAAAAGMLKCFTGIYTLYLAVNRLGTQSIWALTWSTLSPVIYMTFDIVFRPKDTKTSDTSC